MQGENQLNNNENRSELVLVPNAENLVRVADYLRGELTAHSVPEKMRKRLLIAFDELYANVMSYSGAQIAEIRCSFEEHTLELLLRDNGVPYNPLEKAEPDTGTSAAERKLGGLGIYMAKKMADRLEYRYVNGCNEITLTVGY